VQLHRQTALPFRKNLSDAAKATRWVFITITPAESRNWAEDASLFARSHSKWRKQLNAVIRWRAARSAPTFLLTCPKNAPTARCSGRTIQESTAFPMERLDFFLIDVSRHFIRSTCFNRRNLDSHGSGQGKFPLAHVGNRVRAKAKNFPKCTTLGSTAGTTQK